MDEDAPQAESHRTRETGSERWTDGRERPHPAPGPRRGDWWVAVVAAAGLVVGGGVVAFVTSGPPSAEVAPVPRAMTASVSPASAPAAAAPSAAFTPKWTGGVQPGRPRHAAVVYELEAEKDISVFGKRVRPVLAVRCVQGSSEAFVVTQSAAAMERADGLHTVQVTFDGVAGPPERWIASEDYDALFAPDAVAVARRIAAARTMQFGFTPYNAAPAVAEFDVRGFGTLITDVAKACRWQD